jgi:hypothetical protein
MASTLDKLELQNSTLEAVQLFIGIYVSKYSLEIAINKNWLENQSDLEEDKYESPTLVYYKETDAMVPLVKANL